MRPGDDRPEVDPILHEAPILARGEEDVVTIGEEVVTTRVGRLQSLCRPSGTVRETGRDLDGQAEGLSLDPDSPLRLVVRDHRDGDRWPWSIDGGAIGDRFEPCLLPREDDPEAVGVFPDLERFPGGVLGRVEPLAKEIHGRSCGGVAIGRRLRPGHLRPLGADRARLLGCARRAWRCLALGRVVSGDRRRDDCGHRGNC